jgi:hypothetical protein
MVRGVCARTIRRGTRDCQLGNAARAQLASALWTEADTTQRVRHDLAAGRVEHRWRCNALRRRHATAVHEPARALPGVRRALSDPRALPPRVPAGNCRALPPHLSKATRVARADHLNDSR